MVWEALPRYTASEYESLKPLQVWHRRQHWSTLWLTVLEMHLQRVTAKEKSSRAVLASEEKIQEVGRWDGGVMMKPCDWLTTGPSL
jgi:hypothetical protein